MTPNLLPSAALDSAAEAEQSSPWPPQPVLPQGRRGDRSPGWADPQPPRALSFGIASCRAVVTRDPPVEPRQVLPRPTGSPLLAHSHQCVRWNAAAWHTMRKYFSC